MDRFDFNMGHFPHTEKAENGKYVLFDDHESENKALKAEVERLTKAQVERDAMRTAWHHLINPDKDFYSWQRDWQDGARLVLGLPEDASVEDINLALLLRGKALGEK